ncbi:MAG: hypothetical protein ABI185_02365 [Ginsengibacter sp.]
MVFNQFITIIGGFLGLYYFVIVLFDLLKQNNSSVQATNNSIQFEKSEKPIIISEDSQEKNQPVKLGIAENIKNYFPSSDVVKNEDGVKKSSPIIDLGLETISGDAYTLSAENLSKFMFR